MADKPKELVAAEEEQKISRAMMVWVNSYPDLPDTINRVNFEQFQANAAGEALVPGMVLSTIQGAYITRRFVYGGHQGEYQFSIFYRIKPGNSNDARLKADELLNAVGDWARQNPPELGEEIRVLRCEPTSRAALLGVTESGDEDHQILMRMTYEVITNDITI